MSVSGNLQSSNDITEISKLLSFILDLKDPYTADHSKVVRTISVFLGNKIGVHKNRLANLNIGGYLHDIGKISIPDNILFKPGKLDKDEFEVIKTHTTFGGEFLEKFDGLQKYKDIVLYHHEKYNGAGYPCGLTIKKIPLEARIIAIADVYHALYSKRCYKEAFDTQRIIEEFKKSRNSHFDPYLVDEMISSIESKEIETLINEQNYLDEFEAELQEQLNQIPNEDDSVSKIIQMIDVLTTALDIMNPPYADHCKNVKNTTRIISEKMQLDKKTIDKIVLSASLHDIGRLGQRTGLAKIGAVDEHSTLGEQMLSSISYFQDILPIIRHHHELYDGSGFPDKLKGKDIPLGSRIIGIADHFDAFCKRPDPILNRALTKKEAKQKMAQFSGKLFDPDILSAFLECDELFGD